MAVLMRLNLKYRINPNCSGLISGTHIYSLLSFQSPEVFLHMYVVVSSALVVVAASFLALWINDRFPLGGYVSDEITN
jgi:hypothetical protein